MEIIVDNKIVNLLIHDATTLAKNPWISSTDNSISFRWPSLLEYLGLGSLFSTLPIFDQSQPMFTACIETLSSNEEKEVIFYVFDHLFAEHLNQIKALRQINASFLLHAIEERRAKAEKFISSTLLNYEKAFKENASHAMHDLILYLAWDRMCVWMGHLFNYQSTDSKFLKAITVLKECLVESYQHISRQGRTAPSFYRMLEALFFYQMREENIQKHTDEEWTLLSQSFPILKGQNELIDFFYIDDAMTSGSHSKKNPENSICYLTLDSSDRVNSRLALAQYMVSKLKEEIVDWDYVLQPQQILHLCLKS